MSKRDRRIEPTQLEIWILTVAVPGSSSTNVIERGCTSTYVVAFYHSATPAGAVRLDYR